MIRTLLCLLVVTMSAPFGSAQGASESRRLLITFKEGTSAERQAKILDALGAESVESWESLEAAAAVVAEERALALLDSAAASDPAVEAVEEDRYIQWIKAGEPGFQGTPLPDWARVQAALPAFRRAPSAPLAMSDAEIPWGVARVNAPAAWAVTRGEGVRVAVVDTGIDRGHPDLRDNFEGCYNAISPGSPCDDGNGHGTHVAGTIAAARDGQGVAGVAPQARLYAVKVLDASGGGRLSWIINGIAWCAEKGISVANMSLGSPDGAAALHRAVKKAASKGVTIVAAAGNADGGPVGYPAAYPETIAVSASDDQDRLAAFSSRGLEVDFIAPGQGVNSTLPGGIYAQHSGTSMAAPHVAGLAALAVARGARGPQSVREALGRAASSLGLGAEAEGRGLVDAGRIGK